jgi:hypothetical protein
MQNRGNPRQQIGEQGSFPGQFILYQGVPEESEPDRRLYLASPRKVVDDLFQEPIGQLLLKRERVRLLVFDPDLEVIVEWIPH